MTNHFYQLLFADQPASPYSQRAQTLAAVTFELTQFLVDVLGVTDVGSRFQGKVTYHACCHLLRELGIDAQPRQLLAAMPGADVVELNGADECCGFGGLFALKNAGISTAMGQRKTRNIAASDVDVVALCDVSCMTHINGLLNRQAQRCRAVHIAEVLNSQVDVVEREPVGPATTPERAPRRWQDAKA